MKLNTALSLSHVFVSLVSGKSIISDISMRFEQGKIHVIMGPNGSGKSTLANVLMGNPEYKVKGNIVLGKKDITTMKTSDRAQAGIFLAFQSPVAIAGVSVTNLLRAAYQELHPKSPLVPFLETIKKQATFLHIDPSLLTRSIHDGFSGGERKKIEVLQALVLQPKFAIFDEIDTGLDVDALKIVASGIEELRKNGTGCIIITHYQRLLRHVHPDVVTVIKHGAVIKTGDAKLAKAIERTGYGDE